MNILQTLFAAYPILVVVSLAMCAWLPKFSPLTWIGGIGLLAAIPIGVICFFVTASTFGQRNSLWWRLAAFTLIAWLASIVVLVLVAGLRDAPF